MNMRILTPEELKRAYDTDLTEAFPPSELKPLAAMESLRKRGVYDPLGFFDEAGEILGYMLVWRHSGGRYALIDYFCVPAGKRGRGTGGRLLDVIREYYPPDTVFIGESGPGRRYPAPSGFLLAQRSGDAGIRLRLVWRAFQNYMLGWRTAGRGGNPSQASGNLSGAVWAGAV